MLFAAVHDGFAGPEFLDLLRTRDETALQRLVNAYLPQILRAARGAGLNLQNAEDVCQSTFITFIEKIDDFEDRSHVRTWLFGILYRKISEMRRSASREGAAENIDQVMENRFKTDGHWQQPPRGADMATYESEVREHLADCLEGSRRTSAWPSSCVKWKNWTARRSAKPWTSAGPIWEFCSTGDETC